MENLPPPQEKELSSPNEKLLRSPTFWEKYAKTINWMLLISILIISLLSASILILKSKKSVNAPLQPAPYSTSPDTALQTYYNLYLACKKYHLSSTKTGKVSKSSQEDCPYNKTGLLTSKLANTLQQVKGFAPVLCAQNTPIELTYDKAVITNMHATAIVHTVWGASPKQNISVGLDVQNGEWKISSITCPLDLSGQTETRTIDSTSGEILEKKNNSPTPNPETENWKTYTNNAQHYSFQYPDSWKINDNYSCCDFTIAKNATQSVYTKLRVSVYQNLQNIPLVQWVRQEMQGGELSNIQNIPATNPGIEAMEIDWRPGTEDPDTYQSTLIKTKTQIYKIDWRFMGPLRRDINNINPGYHPNASEQ